MKKVVRDAFQTTHGQAIPISCAEQCEKPFLFSSLDGVHDGHIFFSLQGIGRLETSLVNSLKMEVDKRINGEGFETCMGLGKFEGEEGRLDPLPVQLSQGSF